MVHVARDIDMEEVGSGFRGVMSRRSGKRDAFGTRLLNRDLPTF